MATHQATIKHQILVKKLRQNYTNLKYVTRSNAPKYTTEKQHRFKNDSQW